MKLVICILVLVVSITASTALTQGEKEAISALYDEWSDLRLANPPWTSNSSAACDEPPFQYITCTDGPDPHVSSLNVHNLPYSLNETWLIPEAIGGLLWLEQLILSDLPLRGEIPSTIGLLTNLKTFQIQDRESLAGGILGGIPATIGNLFNLTSISLHLPKSSGSIPSEIGNLTNLRSFQFTTRLDSHGFAYVIPTSFCALNLEVLVINGGLPGLERCKYRLNQLIYLDISYLNSYRSPFESLVRHRPNMTYLDVSYSSVRGQILLASNLSFLKARGSQVSGDVPSSLFLNTHLTYLDLRETDVALRILPAGIGRLEKLVYLDLSFAGFVAELPPEIGLCKSLQFLKIENTGLVGTLPPEIGHLSNLALLSISSSHLHGSIPSSFSGLTRLFYLSLPDNVLSGTIPNSLTELRNLRTLQLNDNRFSGTIPSFQQPFDSINLQNNLLEGSIPPSILNSSVDINLSQNSLSGTIPASLSENSVLDKLRLNHNRLSGSIPNFSKKFEELGTITHIDLASNLLSGSLPDQFLWLRVSILVLENNLIEGRLAPLFNPQSVIVNLDSRSNRFSGTLPDLFQKSLSSLLVGDNRLFGRIPLLPPTTMQFDGSHNSFYTGLERLLSGPQGGSALQVVDLSHNILKGTLPDHIFHSNLIFLSLADNGFVGTIPQPTVTTAEEWRRTLQTLDLSNNQLTGTFPSASRAFSTLATLRLTNNQLSGTFPVSSLPHLTILNIKQNRFSFDALAFTSRAFLATLDASENQIGGTLSLIGMSSLKTAIFDGNNLTGIDFRHLSAMFSSYNLDTLSILRNGDLPKYPDFTTQSGAPRRTKTKTPSELHPGVICYQLAFGKSEQRFSYDEWLFDYRQCECDRAHYGLPPNNCFNCPLVGTSPSNCSGANISVNPNYFLFNALEEGPLEVESCIPEDFRAIGTSNCLGIGIEFDYNGPKLFDWQTGSPLQKAQLSENVNASLFPTSILLTQQCREGSSGRLCSKCDCDTHSGKCFFPGPAQICKPCSKIFSAAVFVPTSLVLAAIIILILSVIFYFILKSKRTLNITKWENLPLGKKLVYRVIHLTSIGQITIMVTFVQIVIELTHWDAYAVRSWLKLINGESEGLGLRCFFPFLADPMSMLILRLLVPFMVMSIVCASIGLAELGHRFLAHMGCKNDLDSDSIDRMRSLDDMAPLISGDDKSRETSTKDIHVPYPALSLATSISISIIKFFYFGTALGAHEYLFPTTQKATNLKFVQSVPWMKYSEAKALRSVSIPFIMIFLAGLPVSFFAICWKMRHKISSPVVRMYLGSIFENFQPYCFWWEIVNVMRKLSIALFLRGINPGSAFQPLLISFIIGSLGISNLGLRPWKKVLCNWFEAIASLLLILSMASSRLSGSSDSSAATIVIISFDVCFVLACIGIIAYDTLTGETDYERMWKIRFEKLDSKLDSGAEYGPPLLNQPSLLTLDENSEVDS